MGTRKDVPSLPYIQCIVKETTRLHPVALMLVPRLALEDCKEAGYDIQKGTRVLVNVWTIGRDPTIWENPNEFCPDRFVGKKIDVKGQDFELLPFGSGRRMCPGYSLGLKVIESSLANLLHGFNWKLPENMRPQDLNMEELFALSTQKSSLWLLYSSPGFPWIFTLSDFYMYVLICCCPSSCLLSMCRFFPFNLLFYFPCLSALLGSMRLESTGGRHPREASSDVVSTETFL